MKEFEFTVPQKIVFGMGSLEKLPEIAEKSGMRRALVVSGPNLSRMGVVRRVMDCAEKGGILCEAFTDVEANPSVTTVEKAAKAYRTFGADGMIALGGGSPMDVAKAMGVIAQYGGSVCDYEGAGKIPGPVPPIIAIPTTAGTGSEVTACAVITDTARSYKLTVFGPQLYPSYAILDPALILTTPAPVAAACGVDALIHAMEAYVSTAASPFSESMSEKAMELIGRNLRRFFANRQDEEAASEMLLGSTLAGIAFASAKLGNVHAMSHPVSAYFHVAHGVANAILLPVVAEYNALADHGKFQKIYGYLHGGGEGSFRPQLLVDELRELNRSLGIPAALREVGVREDAIPVMAADAMKSGNILVNPRRSTLEDIERLYHKAL